MVKRIEKDCARFKELVRGKVRKDLRKYITQGEMIGRKGKHLVSIPVPGIRIPTFHFGDNARGGVGQGEGEVGSSIGSADDADGKGVAGDQPGAHILEVDVTIEELARIMGEELELPRIKPKGKSAMIADTANYTGISRAGPESLRHFKRTYREALKRLIALGLYNPDDPVIVPVREDKRYRSWKVRERPQNNAVILYMMDVSGSMGDEQKEIVRIETFWIDTWLHSQYKKIETRYIVHDAAAKEVDRNTFFHVKESGGTKISSAFTLCSEIVRKDFNPDEWNIYPMHFSDGDNWGNEDTRRCIEILGGTLLPVSNVFCYGQVKSAYGSGQFKKDLDESFAGDDRIITSEIRDKDGIYDSIKEFLGKGK
ncbi:MAG: hypothetical protein A2Z34_09355 [Planctomycetes bacterium RBG_16_59_8]|nr:MAG: hypothetical protein A2Z34_09355 [Planctomycetes bacterium RBG_16_59_8]